MLAILIAANLLLENADRMNYPMRPYTAARVENITRVDNPDEKRKKGKKK